MRPPAPGGPRKRVYVPARADQPRRDGARRSIVAERFYSPTIVPRLIGGAKGDPALWLDLADHNHAREALLFDCGGSVGRLSPVEVGRLTRVFISHTHMDHWMGFDSLLRKLVASENPRRLEIFGSAGMTGYVRGRLSGYVWNLLDLDHVIFEVTELSPEGRETTTLRVNGALRGEPRAHEARSDAVIVETPAYRVRYAALDHKIPSLAFAFEHKPYVEIDKDKLQTLGQPEGPWLRALKEGRENAVPLPDTVPSWDWARRELLITRPGEKITYVTDCKATEEVIARVRDLAWRSDLFFCEASFLEEDRQRADTTHHLTAAQAGLLAREAQVRTLLVSHFSSIYAGREHDLVQEARSVFSDTWMYT